MQMVIDDRKKSDSKSSSSTDNVSLGSGNGAAGEIVDSGAAETRCPPCHGADASVRQEPSPRKLVEANGHALRYYGVRLARQVRVKLVVTDVMLSSAECCTADRAGIQG